MFRLFESLSIRHNFLLLALLALAMSLPPTVLLIRDLLEHSTQPCFVHAHRWAVGDVVMWDNRTTLHRGRAYDDRRYKRDMRRVTLSDVAPTLEQQAA
jgi:alpha-ketoglutarate-dependent 2,4-dichlorophenoxyacetate dioxygenase